MQSEVAKILWHPLTTSLRKRQACNCSSPSCLSARPLPAAGGMHIRTYIRTQRGMRAQLAFTDRRPCARSPGASLNSERRIYVASYISAYFYVGPFLRVNDKQFALNGSSRKLYTYINVLAMFAKMLLLSYDIRLGASTHHSATKLWLLRSVKQISRSTTLSMYTVRRPVSLTRHRPAGSLARSLSFGLSCSLNS